MKPPATPVLLLLAFSLTVWSQISVADEPSEREKKILANAEPGIPVTLPGRKSEVEMRLTGTTESPSDPRLMMRKPLKKKTFRSKVQDLKIQAFWFGAEGGKSRVIIDLSHQVAQVWTDDVLVGQSPVSTGREGYDTPSGQYKILQKNIDHHSNLYGSWVDSSGKYVGDASAGEKSSSGYRYVPSPMPFFLRLTHTGVGMHSGFVPGFPASHGCIRLPYNMAEKFFHYLALGTPVEIRE